MKIGVFDSGVGGLSVANAINAAFPEHVVELVEDSAHLPYGNKTPAQLMQLVTPLLQDLAMRTDIIVIACNSLTTNCINELREIITVPLVGIEPMVKPAAAMTKTGRIAVCATPATLSSERYAALKRDYAQNITVIEPDCSDWAAMIEADAVNRHVIRDQTRALRVSGVDVIVLGCTHYHWIKDLIIEIAGPNVIVLQPEQAVISQLGRKLQAL